MNDLSAYDKLLRKSIKARSRFVKMHARQGTVVFLWLTILKDMNRSVDCVKILEGHFESSLCRD